MPRLPHRRNPLPRTREGASMLGSAIAKGLGKEERMVKPEPRRTVEIGREVHDFLHIFSDYVFCSCVSDLVAPEEAHRCGCDAN